MKIKTVTMTGADDSTKITDLEFFWRLNKFKINKKEFGF